MFRTRSHIRGSCLVAWESQRCTEWQIKFDTVMLGQTFLSLLHTDFLKIHFGIFTELRAESFMSVKLSKILKAMLCSVKNDMNLISARVAISVLLEVEAEVESKDPED